MNGFPSVSVMNLQLLNGCLWFCVLVPSLKYVNFSKPTQRYSSQKYWANCWSLCSWSYSDIICCHHSLSILKSTLVVLNCSSNFGSNLVLFRSVLVDCLTMVLNLYTQGRMSTVEILNDTVMSKTFAENEFFHLKLVGSFPKLSLSSMHCMGILVSC